MSGPFIFDTQFTMSSAELMELKQARQHFDEVTLAYIESLQTDEPKPLRPPLPSEQELDDVRTN